MHKVFHIFLYLCTGKRNTYVTYGITSLVLGKPRILPFQAKIHRENSSHLQFTFIKPMKMTHKICQARVMNLSVHNIRIRLRYLIPSLPRYLIVRLVAPWAHSPLHWKIGMGNRISPAWSTIRWSWICSESWTHTGPRGQMDCTSESW